MADTKDIEDRLTALEKKYERWSATLSKYEKKLNADRNRRGGDAKGRLNEITKSLDSLESELKKNSGSNEDVFREIRKALKQINKELDDLPTI